MYIYIYMHGFSKFSECDLLISKPTKKKQRPTFSDCHKASEAKLPLTQSPLGVVMHSLVGCQELFRFPFRTLCTISRPPLRPYARTVLLTFYTAFTKCDVPCSLGRSGGAMPPATTPLSN